MPYTEHVALAYYCMCTSYHVPDAPRNEPDNVNNSRPDVCRKIAKKINGLLFKESSTRKCIVLVCMGFNT